jgi:hypothetical protein
LATLHDITLSPRAKKLTCVPHNCNKHLIINVIDVEEDFAFLDPKTYNTDVTLYLNPKILSNVSSMPAFNWLSNEIAFVTFSAL